MEEGEVGREASFKITTKDSAGKQCYDVDDYGHVKVQTPSGEELTNVIVAGKDGEYSVTYTPDCDGQHDVLVVVNCQPLSASPWRVHVVPHCYKSVVSFNLQGKEKGQFNSSDIAIHDKLRNVAVADYWNGVHLVKLEGTCHKVYETHKLTIPTAVAFSRSGELIVIASKRIFRFNENDKFIGYVTKTHLREPKHLTIARDGAWCCVTGVTMQSRFCPLTVHSCYSLSVILIVRAHGLVCVIRTCFLSPILLQVALRYSARMVGF